ncbi:MAG TPA: cytochrome P450 [Solirubrobacteraceae bacterium]|nr:cytochrome P450 [Solirubrobacteraceae bacterium]
MLWGLRYPQFTRAGHERFGPTFTIRPGTMAPAVLTTDAGAIRRLLTGDPLAKGHGNDAVRPLIGERSVLLLGPAEHLARRKLLLPPFHGERVRGYAALMQRLMDAEVERWRPGDTVAMLPTAQNVTIEVILQAVLGVADPEMRRRFRGLIDDLLFYPLGALRLRLSGRLTPRVAPPRRLREAAAFAASLPTPAVMTYFPEAKPRTRWNLATWRWWRLRDRLYALLDEHIAATRADPGLAEREDILAMLVQARDEDGRALSDADLRDDLLALIGAGHETTAAAIAWGAALLAHHPAERARAAAAAREGDEARLGALVKEVLRIRPPLPVAAGRVLDEPFAIGPHTVPAGTLILIDAWGLHHDPDRHPDPERFWPERFLDDPPEPYSWLPFGGGAHRCIGSALAELEIGIALSTILRRVDLAPADAELAPPARRGVTVVPHAGGRVAVA